MKPAKIKAEKFDRPGFLRFTASVEVDGKKYFSYATAGFSPEKIQPTTTLPVDFESFWNKGKEDLAKVPVNPILTLIPERSTAKANVYHVQLDNIDGENIGVTGGSQGGALSIVTAGLDSRISYLAAVYPALSDLTGFLNERAGGWPQIFTDEFTNKPEKIETSKYFDVVNFVRFVKVPGFYSWGYNDNVCPPTSMYAAYNVLNSEKELHVFQETQHWAFPEQHEMKNKWLFEKLKN